MLDKLFFPQKYVTNSFILITITNVRNKNDAVMVLIGIPIMYQGLKHFLPLHMQLLDLLKNIAIYLRCQRGIHFHWTFVGRKKQRYNQIQ